MKMLLVTLKLEPETKAEVTGLLKKFKNYQYLVQTCVYLDLLEKFTPVSKVFEGDGLLPFEVNNAIKLTINELQDLSDVEYDDIDSHLQRYYPKESNKIEAIFDSKLDKSRKLENRNPVPITLDLTSVNEETVNAARAMRRTAASELIVTLTERFRSFNEEDVFTCMDWCDPSTWSDERDHGLEQLKSFADHFASPLSNTAYNSSKLQKE